MTVMFRGHVIELISSADTEGSSVSFLNYDRLKFRGTIGRGGFNGRPLV